VTENFKIIASDSNLSVRFQHTRMQVDRSTMTTLDNVIWLMSAS